MAKCLQYIKVSKRKYKYIIKHLDGLLNSGEVLTLQYKNTYMIREDVYVWFFGTSKKLVEFLSKMTTLEVDNDKRRD